MARQNNRLSKPRLTRFNAVRQFILDEKCGVRDNFISPIANPTACSSNSHRAASLVNKEHTAITHRSDGGVGAEGKMKMIALKDKDLFRQQALIGGNWRNANEKATVDVIDPASQQV